MENEIEINGIKYTRKTEPTKRAVVVVDRGWIFAGDITESNGRIFLTKAVWVLRWESIGFDGVIATPNSSNVILKAIDDVDIPVGSELFRVPVNEGWGL